MASTPAPTVAQNVNPSEVGWQFVPQYYTFVNKHPGRLHCFYTKQSTFIHGTEGEDLTSCHGQQEIHNKITSIGFQDCKVFIDCVDAQASANGGIVIQVIGEMSNRGEPWKKFVQTFFLAEQPGGYFVLNDIFRFLKEDSVDGEEGGNEPENPATAEAVQLPHVSAPAPPAVAEPAVIPESEPAPAAVAVEEPVAASEPEVALPSPSPEPHVNGVNHAEHESEAEAEAEAAPESVAASVPESTDEEPETIAEPAVSEPEAPAPAPAAPSAVSSQPQQQPTPSPTPALAAAPAPTPATPAAPKTWANLAATNSKQWGTAVAKDSRGTSEAPPPAPAVARPAPPPAGVASRPPPPRGNVDGHPLYLAVQALTTPQCFVKGVTENVPTGVLNAVLTQRFGPIKELEIVRSKACAFLEFNTLDAAKRAIVASLPISAGGDGGIRIDVEGGQARISVETRKERGERPVSRPRGGAPVNGELRGGFRGRGGGPRGRGAPPGTKV